MKFIALSREFNTIKNQFTVVDIIAKDEETAWQQIEEEVQTFMNQVWVMTPKQFKELTDLLAVRG